MKRRPITLDEAEMLASFYSRMPIARIREAAASGSTLELEESDFHDHGDFVRIVIDGKVVFYAEGY